MMQDQNQGARPLYRDIAERTQGDLYIGVVGPVRTGKSTFIKHFMEQLVLPLMAPGPRRDRLNDELPQSGSGKTVMTTQPQFIPGEGAAQVQIEPGVGARVLRASLENKYDVPVTLLNVKEMRQEDMQKLLSSLLLEFPLREVRFSVPGWMGALDGQHWLPQHAIETVRTLGETMQKMRDKEGVTAAFAGSPYRMAPRDEQVLLGEGILCCDLPVKEGLFNQVLSEQRGETITGDAHLLSLMKELVAAKREYNRVAGALKAVQQTGYGLVTPAMSEVELQQPVLMSQGSRYGVRLKASAPTLHLIRSDIETEIAPVLGTQEQSEAFVDTLRDAFEKDPQSLWDTNFFGKSLKDLIQEGVMSKLNRMPVDTREKVQAALTKMLNEGDGGMICILLGCHNVAPKIPCTFFRICGMINRVQSTGIRMENEAFALYTEQDYQDIASQLRRRWIALLIPSVLMLAGVVASFVARIRPLTIGLSIALGVIFIFCFGMFISPVNAYLRHLDDVLHGRVRQVTGAFKSMNQQSVTRDGVRYYPMMINVGSMEDEEDDRLFYYDANLPRPDWQVGEKLTVTAHDKALGAWERAA